MSDFDRAVDFVLRHEGGLVDDPHDTGGITNFGISLRFLRDVDSSATADDIRNMTRAGAAALYRQHFWGVCKCDQMPDELAMVVFDCAVNQGPGAAAKLLQRALRVIDDGIIGTQTLAAANTAGPSEIVDLLARRAKRYAAHPQVQRYGRGWYTRLFELQRVILSSS